MLMLSRKLGESFYATASNGERIKITFCGCQRRDVASIGIEAPQEVEVWREEIQERIDAEAGSATPPSGL